MFRAQENDPAQRRARYLSVIMLLVCLILAGSGRLYAGYEADRQATLGRPNLAAKSLVLDVRLFLKQKTRFPADWAELEDTLWRPRRNQGRAENPRVSVLTNGPRLYVRDNYLYLYQRGNDRLCALWAVPLGPQRETAQTVFVLLTPERQEVWRGPALTDEFVAKLPVSAVPTYEQMALLGLSQDQGQPPKKSWLSALAPF